MATLPPGRGTPRLRRGVTSVWGVRGAISGPPGVDDAGDRAAEGAVGDHRRVLARPADDRDEDLLGAPDDGQAGVVVGDRVHPARPVVDAVHAAQLALAQRAP